MVTHNKRRLLPHGFTLTLTINVRAVYFLLHFLFSINRDLPVKKYGALCCPDFPRSCQRQYRDRSESFIFLRTFYSSYWLLAVYFWPFQASYFKIRTSSYILLIMNVNFNSAISILLEASISNFNLFVTPQLVLQFFL